MSRFCGQRAQEGFAWADGVRSGVSVRGLLSGVVRVFALVAGVVALAAPAAAGGPAVVQPDLWPILPIQASGLPSVFVDPYEQPGLVVYRFDAVIWNGGGALDVCHLPTGEVMQILWPAGTPTDTNAHNACPGLGGVDRAPFGAVLVTEHSVWHFEHAARYELLLPGGGSRLIEKVGFCLVDTYNTLGIIAYFSGTGWCGGIYGRMGISPQIGDIYTSRNSVQWIDVTGLRPGLYTLRATVNPANQLIESNTANNVLDEVRAIPGAIANDVTLTTPPGTPATIALSGSVVAPEINAIKHDSCSYYSASCYIDALDDGSLTFAIVAPPQHGTLSTIATLNDTSATVTYTPNPGYTGADTFTYTTKDSRNLTSLPATTSLGVGASAPAPPGKSPAPPLPEPPSDPDGKTKPKRTLLTGTRFADVVRGTRAAEIYRLFRGADKVRAGGGSDVVFAGPGRDLVRGGPGNDELYGGPGRDILIGGPGNDTINARDGRRDRVRCGPGIDTVIIDRVLDRMEDDCEIVELIELAHEHEHEDHGYAG
jgi:hypothetical protein